MQRVAFCARRTGTASTCSTENDTESRQGRMREDDDDAAEQKAAREGPVAACGRGHQETGPASQEPEAGREAKLFEEDTVFVGRNMGRVNVHKTSASRESSVRRMMDKLTVYTHVARFMIRSRGASRCVACGWGRGNPGGNMHEMSKVGLCITALMR